MRETSTGCLSYVPQPGTEPATFWCTGWCSNQMNHTSRARQWFWNAFKVIKPHAHRHTKIQDISSWIKRRRKRQERVLRKVCQLNEIPRPHCENRQYRIQSVQYSGLLRTTVWKKDSTYFLHFTEGRTKNTANCIYMIVKQSYGWSGPLLLL